MRFLALCVMSCLFLAFHMKDENMEYVKTYIVKTSREWWWWWWWGKGKPLSSLIQLSETFKQVNLINFLIRQALKTLEKGSSLIYLSVVHTIPLYGGSSTESNLWINLQSLENAFSQVNFGSKNVGPLNTSPDQTLDRVNLGFSQAKTPPTRP